MYIFLEYTFSPDVNDCVADVCQNGGTCIDRVNGFYCLCTTEFTGAFCQSKSFRKLILSMWMYTCQRSLLPLKVCKIILPKDEPWYIIDLVTVSIIWI